MIKINSQCELVSTLKGSNERGGGSATTGYSAVDRGSRIRPLLLSATLNFCLFQTHLRPTNRRCLAGTVD